MSSNVFLTKASAYGMRAVKWLVPGWLARGELHIFAGDAKTGKSLTLTTMAAKFTTGGQFFNEAPLPKCSVAFYTPEDDYRSALIPRFMQAGGDPDMFYVGSPRVSAAEDPLALIEHLYPVRGELGVVVIDGIAAGLENMNDLVEVRKYLNRVKQVAEDLNVAVVGITHTPKGAATRYTNPLDYVTGCGAWTQVPRVTWILVRDKQASKPATLLTRYGNLPRMSNGGIRLYAGPEVILARDGDGDPIEVGTIDLDESEVLDGNPADLFAAAIDASKSMPGQAKNQQAIDEGSERLLGVLRESDEFHEWREVVKTTLSDMSKNVCKAILANLEGMGIVKVRHGIKGSPARTKWIGLVETPTPLPKNVSDASWMANVADINANPVEKENGT